MKISSMLLAAAMAAVVPGISRAELVPGGPTVPASKLAADCYGELDVADLSSAEVTTNPKGVPTIACSDGAACDSDGAADGKCTFSLTVCINQTNVETCTPPANLEKLKASGKSGNAKGKIDIGAPQLLAGSVCGSFVDFVVPLKKGTKPGKGKATIAAKGPKGTKPRSDKDKVTFVCNPPSSTTTTTIPGGCATNDAGGPNRFKMTVAQNGNDLDNGWTGQSQNFSVTPNGSINACLSNCNTTDDTLCDADGSTGQNSLNGLTFGAPLPLLTSNVPVCVVNRFNPGQPVTGTADFATGEINLNVQLLSDVFITVTDNVCPRCTNSKCNSGQNQGKPCTVDATLVVAESGGNKTYQLSNACPPVGNPQATLNIVLPLTSGTTAPLIGPTPCPRNGAAGIPPKPNNCGASGCGAPCSLGSNACVQMVPDPTNPAQMVCQDSKGGISQMCCNNDPTTPCFPLENGGQLIRTGLAVPPAPAFPDTTFPKSATGVLGAVFCEAATGASNVDSVTGLPGPSALLLNGPQDWTIEPSE